MRLTKHHGLGNDFLVALDQGEASATLARTLCDRRRGIGADGLISGCTARGPMDVVMVLRNADGGHAEMSGNGVRCLAHAVLHARGLHSGTVVVGTDAGVCRVEITGDGRSSVCLAEVDLGPARPGPAWSEAPPEGLVDALGSGALRAATVDIGNPHLVIEALAPGAVDLRRFGPRLEASFPNGVNVEFIGSRAGRLDELDVVVWERGVGITDACGTGAGAAATAAHNWGLVGQEVTVHLPGGTVGVCLGSTVTLRGEVVHVADIEVPDIEVPDADAAGIGMGDRPTNARATDAGPVGAGTVDACRASEEDAGA